jgi:hypothetical protein
MFIVSCSTRQSFIHMETSPLLVKCWRAGPLNRGGGIFTVPHLLWPRTYEHLYRTTPAMTQGLWAPLPCHTCYDPGPMNIFTVSHLLWPRAYEHLYRATPAMTQGLWAGEGRSLPCHTCYDPGTLSMGEEIFIMQHLRWHGASGFFFFSGLM